MEKWIKPFYIISLWIVKRLPLRKTGERARRTEERLKALGYGENRLTLEEHYAKSLAAALAVLFWGLGFVVLVQIAAEGDGKETFWNLQRPSYGQGDQETELIVYVQGETEEAQLSLKISERRYTEKEMQQIFSQIMEEMDQRILGQNETLDEVRSDLTLPSTMRDGAVTLEWVLNPSDVMDDQGRIEKEVGEKGELVELTALMKYKDQEAEYRCLAHVYPPVKSPQEKLEAVIQEEVVKADQNSIYEETLNLPRQVDGRSVSWASPEEGSGIILALLVPGAALAVFRQRDKKLEKLEQTRRNQLVLDYPDLLFKLTMLLGAGMTIKGAFVKIASEYNARRGRQPRYVYEEMLAACREIQSGIGEARAYENFGRRCGEIRYIKLGSILSQNLKKGSQGLCQLLEAEAQAGMEERRNAARKLGEEAGTKLLLPMMLMLAVVLVILIIPAMMAF